METTKETKMHKYLHEIAFRQGVKPANSKDDLYPKSIEKFDVDYYLKEIDQIRKSDEKKK